MKCFKKADGLSSVIVVVFTALIVLAFAVASYTDLLSSSTESSTVVGSRLENVAELAMEG